MTHIIMVKFLKLAQAIYSATPSISTNLFLVKSHRCYSIESLISSQTVLLTFSPFLPIQDTKGFSVLDGSHVLEILIQVTTQVLPYVKAPRPTRPHRWFSSPNFRTQTMLWYHSHKILEFLCLSLYFFYLSCKLLEERKNRLCLLRCPIPNRWPCKLNNYRMNMIKPMKWVIITHHWSVSLTHSLCVRMT